MEQDPQNSILLSLNDRVQTIQLTLESLRSSLQKIDNIYKIVFGNGDLEGSLVIRVDRIEQRNQTLGNTVNRLIYPLVLMVLAFIGATFWAIVTGKFVP